ncbi:MAG: Acyl-[acyl-carrier-protein]--UDP-N-acetylglucosamine O-acyltransferase [Pedosphaera sp.]|nr:Acyl-[acyl-carrier-protein]--UDP-N-acetylglucosamine O-acyltransferase [Pedosphaera sp.]
MMTAEDEMQTAKIHSSAIIHPKAEIGPDCEIGPYCIIGAHVALGAGCKLHSHVVIDGHTRLGVKNEIYPFASIGLKSQDLKWKGGITRTVIGDHNCFREYVSIHSATQDGDATTVGSHNNLLAYCHVAHDVTMGSQIVMSNVGTLGGHVTVEDYATIGGLAAVHQFCRIGRMSLIGAASKAVQDVLPYMLADGNPAETRTINKVGMERKGVSEEVQSTMRQAYKILFREGLSIPNALARIEKELAMSPEMKHLVEFVRSSERGISK